MIHKHHLLIIVNSQVIICSKSSTNKLDVLRVNTEGAKKKLLAWLKDFVWLPLLLTAKDYLNLIITIGQHPKLLE